VQTDEILDFFLKNLSSVKTPPGALGWGSLLVLPCVREVSTDAFLAGNAAFIVDMVLDQKSALQGYLTHEKHPPP
jgi:hypothetical protein